MSGACAQCRGAGVVDENGNSYVWGRADSHECSRCENTGRELPPPDAKGQPFLGDLPLWHDLRAILVAQANREADQEIARRVELAREAGASMADCANALGLSRQALYGLMERVNGR